MSETGETTRYPPNHARPRPFLPSHRSRELIRQLVCLHDESQRERFLRAHAELLQPATVELLGERVREKVRVDLDDALRSAEAALQIANAIGNRRAIAQGLRAKANALHFLGHNQEAVALHAKAVTLLESAGDAEELGRTLSASIQPLILLGEYERAMMAARRAQKIFIGARDKLRSARLKINIGNIFHRQDRFAEALACYEKAYRGLLPFNEPEGIASSLHNIAVCLIGLNDFRRAAAVHEQARAFCQQHHMPLAVVQADYNIAYLHYLCGRYSLAIELLQATCDKAERVGDAYHAALCRLDLAEIYIELNLVDEAVAAARESFVRFQQLQMPYETAKALTNVAIATGRLGKRRLALELLLQARQVFGRERNGVWTSLIDLYRATILLNGKRYTQSRSLCLNALESFEASHLTHHAVLCRLVLARLELGVKNVKAAAVECRHALSQVAALDAPILAHQAHFLLGQVYERQGSNSAAYKSYQSARELLEALRSNLHREELKIAFAQNRMEVYERLVKICLAGRPRPAGEEAFRYIEEAKSRNLKEAIARHEQPMAFNEARHSAQLQRIRELRESLNWCYRRIEAERLDPDPRAKKRCGELQELARRGETELLRLWRQRPSPDAALAIYRPAGVNLGEVREALGPEADLVEYFRVGRHFWAAVITAHRCKFIRVAEVRPVEASIALFRFQLAKFRLESRCLWLLRKSLLRAAQAHLHELYDALLAPIRHLLRAPHVIFAAHDALHYLPFHALFDGVRYLTDSYTVSYTPSAGVLALCHRRASFRARRSLVLGVPDSRAPNILSEVREVASVLPNAELFIGKRAKEEKLRERGPGCAFIHIATHAYFRQDNPLFSGIRLGDSYLTLLDLYRMNLPAHLVTLSGCATGLSVVAGGDELLGLIRGFITAGAQSLLLTLWDVHDATMTLLVKSFYRRLKDVPDRARALQEAMVEMRQEHPHPYYWAPFLLVGKRTP